jgi:hypothetical protein
LIEGNGGVPPEESHDEWERKFLLNMAEKGKLATLKEEFLFIFISMLKKLPGKRIEIDVPGTGEAAQFQMEFKPHKLVLSLGDTPVIKLAKDLPSDLKQ